MCNLYIYIYIYVLCCTQRVGVDSSSCEESEGVFYGQLSKQVDPDYKQPAEEDIASSSEEELDTKGVQGSLIMYALQLYNYKSFCYLTERLFSMVCSQCLSERSMERQAKRRGTCQNVHHNKVRNTVKTFRSHSLITVCIFCLCSNLL